MQERVFFCSLENMVATKIKGQLGEQYAKKNLSQRLRHDLMYLNDASMDEARHLTCTQIERIVTKELDLSKIWMEKLYELICQPRELYITFEFLSSSMDLLSQHDELI